jgi:chorismate mutase
MGFSSDKIDKSKLYQDRYIKSGISIPANNKFLCVVGNNNILKTSNSLEDQEIEPPKLRPCWVRSLSTSAKEYTDVERENYVKENLSENVSKNDLREKYDEEWLPSYYDTCVIEYKTTCKY